MLQLANTIKVQSSVACQNGTPSGYIKFMLFWALLFTAGILDDHSFVCWNQEHMGIECEMLATCPCQGYQKQPVGCRPPLPTGDL